MNVNEAKTIFKNGYLAMDKNKRWHWYAVKPFQATGCWIANGQCKEEDSFARLQNIDPVDDWKESLTVCGV